MFAILLAIPLWADLTFGMFVLLALFLAGGGLVFINNDSYGVVERRWSRRAGGQDGFMALRGGAGFLPQTIKGGWHTFMPFQYRVHRQKLITVRSIGYLFARTGAPLAEGQALAKGGQGGPQRRILRAGTYAINTALFVVLTDEGVWQIPLGDTDRASTLHALIVARHGFDPVVIDSDRIAIVTVQDGPALEHGEIIAPTVGTDAKNAPIPGYSALSGGRRPPRPAGTGIGGRHLLHQPAVCHSGNDRQDANPDRPCWCGDQLHRPERCGYFG
jgi:uncharacterized membrane protein YqiK